jgi:gluconolactonase
MKASLSFLCLSVSGLVVSLAGCCCCSRNSKPGPIQGDTLGQIERLDPRLDALLPAGAQIEVLAKGFEWSEGPVWVRRGEYLLFSDIPKNVVLKWKEREDISEFLKPSGYAGTEARGGEPGSNGLTVDAQGRLVLCEHGDRRISRLNQDRTKTTLADRYQGKRFNSPNDLTYKSNGDLYFTDPPYGLEKGVDDPKKEIPFQGVYRLSKDGQVALLTSELSRPNGLAFSPNEKILYVANSDPERAVWMSYQVKEDGTLGLGKVFFDATPLVGKAKGLPDGLKVDWKGNLWATGPGGVLVFAPDGTHLGTIQTGEATANCAWGNDHSVLYITAGMYLLRVRTQTKGNIP